MAAPTVTPPVSEAESRSADKVGAEAADTTHLATVGSPPISTQEVEATAAPREAFSTKRENKEEPAIVSLAAEPPPTVNREAKTPATTSTHGSIERGGSGWHTIQIGSYPRIAEATERVAQIKAAGVEAWVVQVEIPPRGTWYRVHTGRFPTGKEARRRGAQLRTSGAVQDFFVTNFQAP